MSKIVKEEKSYFKIILRLVVTFVVNAGLCIAFIAINQGFAGILDSVEELKVIANAFFTSGGIITLIGVLVLLGNHGAFYFLNYAAQSLFSHFVHSLKAGKQTYQEFVEEHRQKKKVPNLFFYIIGGSFLLVGIILTIIVLAKA